MSIDYSSAPLFWSPEKVDLAMGSFVILSREGDGKKSVAQLFEIIDGNTSYYNPHKVRVRMFPPLQSVRFGRTCQRITYGPCQNLTELIQTDQFEVVDSSTIHNIAFVFKPNDPYLVNTICNVGIRNVFLCRWKVNSKNEYESHPDYHSNFGPSFPVPFQRVESYHLKMWEAIDHLRDLLFKCLNTNGDPATLKRVQTGRLSSFAWNYFLRTYGHNLQYPHSYSTLNNTETKKKTRLVPILAAKSTQDEKECRMIRMQLASQLQALRGVLGSYATIGVSRPRPRYGSALPLRYNNTINYVRACAYDGREDNRRITKQDGIDFKRSADDALTVTVRYTTVQFRPDAVESNTVDQLDVHHRPLLKTIPYMASLVPNVSDPQAADNEDGMVSDEDVVQEGVEGELEIYDIVEGASLMWRDRSVYKVISIGREIVLENVDHNDTFGYGNTITVTTPGDILYLKQQIDDYLYNL